MRFGRRGLPELVHEFSIDPPAVPFISDKPLGAPARLLLSLPPPPHAAPEDRSTLGASRPRVGSPLSPGRAPGLLSLLPTRTRGPDGPPRLGRRGRGPRRQRMRAEARRDTRGDTGSPNFRGYPGIAPAQGPPDLSPRIAEAAGARAGGPREPRADRGAGRCRGAGGEGVQAKGKAAAVAGVGSGRADFLIRESQAGRPLAPGITWGPNFVHLTVSRRALGNRKTSQGSE